MSNNDVKCDDNGLYFNTKMLDSVLVYLRSFHQDNDMDTFLSSSNRTVQIREEKEVRKLDLLRLR